MIEAVLHYPTDGSPRGRGWVTRPGSPERIMKPPPSKTRLSDLKPATKPAVFEPPTPKVSRQKRGKVLTPAEKAAFLAGRPDLKS